MTVIRASEPSVVIEHGTPSIYKLCQGVDREMDSEKNKAGMFNMSTKSCLMLWSESLGTRSSMGKLLLEKIEE